MKEEKKIADFSACRAGEPGSKKGIAGCRFLLSPMSDRYEDIILGAVQQVNTQNVWSYTGKLGTVYRGCASDVIDAVRACFTYAWQKDVHMTLSMTLSVGCPGDADEDYILSGAETPANAAALADIHFPVDCAFALYPLGESSYMQLIEEVVNDAADADLTVRLSHYATELSGDVQALFACFERIFAKCEKVCSHFVLEITMSVNSPTVE